MGTKQQQQQQQQLKPNPSTKTEFWARSAKFWVRSAEFWVRSAAARSAENFAFIGKKAKISSLSKHRVYRG